MELELPRHPDRLGALHPRIIEDLLEFAQDNRQEVVDAAIEMLEDLYQHGRESRYLRALKGYPICELKTQSRGGVKGGVRVYLFIDSEDRAFIVNCEAKSDETVSQRKLLEVLVIAAAYKRGVKVLEREVAP